MQSTLTLPKGTHIGEYEILELLGRGAFGAVYRARDAAGGWVALKLIRPDSAADDREAQRVRRRVEREIKALSRVRSSAIVQLYRWGVHDGYFWLAMEYLEGPTLAEILHEGPLAPRRAIGLALQILEGLAVAHDAGIVHRDLKPENIIVQPRRLGGEDAKILDFGVARLQRRSVETFETSDGDKVFGTPAYMAPEQGRGQVSPATDLYAVGTLLHEALLGIRPYHGGTALETMLAKMRDPLPPYLRQSGLPAGLVAAIERALARLPADRPESAAEMYRSIAPFADLDGAPLTAAAPLPTPVGPAATTSHLRGELAAVAEAADAPARRRWGLIALIGLAAVGLGVAAAVALVDDPPATRPAARPVALPTPNVAQPSAAERVVASATPASAAPASATPASAAPASATPASATPASAAPASATPVSAATSAPKTARPRRRATPRRAKPRPPARPARKRTRITDF